ncbi:MAG: hypothetical protein LBM66_03055 [Bifidobacteriaceae bacterium]|jgi:ATP-dependent DNA helicase RecG|nr:hypothetical protein [Bifidobacteriaceae bacterium]
MDGDLTSEVLTGIVGGLRDGRADTANVEVRAAVRRLPASLPATLSAFANGPGGLVLLGLDPAAGFVPTEGFRAKRTRDALQEALTQTVRPALHAPVQVIGFEGHKVVATWVDPIPPRERPCHVRAEGRHRGSYFRDRGTSRRLTPQEVERLAAERHQPHWDEQAVPDATTDDFDPGLVEALVARQRRLRPTVFGGATPAEVLLRLRATRRDQDGVVRPTLGGLLALGAFPQEFFPRLTVDFAAYPGPDREPTLAGEERLLDAVTLAGPIPELVAQTVAAIARCSGAGGEAGPPTGPSVGSAYPPVAVREAVANALMHRDYSEESCGTAVTVDLFPDRLEVTSPGGLFGTATVRTLGTAGPFQTRNPRLCALLEDTPLPDGTMVAGRRGTGFAQILAALAASGSPAPEPHDSVAFFTLVTPHRAAARGGGSKEARRGPDRAATVVSRGTRAHSKALDKVRAALSQANGPASAAELAATTHLSRTAVVVALNRLIAAGEVAPTAPPRSPARRYRPTLYGTARQPSH